jgi:hypothetical protein
VCCKGPDALPGGLARTMGPFSLFFTLLLILPAATAMTHGWDCISCSSNSMLVSNFDVAEGYFPR